MRLFLFCLFSALSCIPAFCEGVVKMPVLRIYFEGQVSRDMDYVNGVDAVDRRDGHRPHLYAQSFKTDNGLVYDLAGWQLNFQMSIVNRQLSKDIYIVDGKKIITF